MGGGLGRTGPEAETQFARAELTKSVEAPGRPQSLQPEWKSRSVQTHSRSHFIRGWGRVPLF